MTKFPKELVHSNKTAIGEQMTLLTKPNKIWLLNK